MADLKLKSERDSAHSHNIFESDEELRLQYEFSKYNLKILTFFHLKL